MEWKIKVGRDGIRNVTVSGLALSAPAASEMRRAAPTVMSIRACGRCAARVDGAISVIEATAWWARWKIGTLTPQTPASTSLSVTA